MLPSFQELRDSEAAAIRAQGYSERQAQRMAAIAYPDPVKIPRQEPKPPRKPSTPRTTKKGK